MLKKDDCEKAIRGLATKWASTQKKKDNWNPCFYTFKTWMQDNGYAHYLNFQTTESTEFLAEMWFAQELKQAWRY